MYSFNGKESLHFGKTNFIGLQEGSGWSIVVFLNGSTDPVESHTGFLLEFAR